MFTQNKKINKQKTRKVLIFMSCYNLLTYGRYEIVT